MKYRIEDLPPAYQAQALAKMAASEKKSRNDENAPFDKSAFDSSVAKPSAWDSVADPVAEIRKMRGNRDISKEPNRRKPKGPNKTEARFNRDVLEGCGIFEGVSFRLPGGTRYTPDFVYWEGGNMFCVEVKGEYRFPSESGAVARFREARAAFPAVYFEWWKWDGKEWKRKE